MGTRSLTVFKDESNNDVSVLYGQFDGYLEGHGKDLAEFCAGKTVVNGIRADHNRNQLANGIGCLAAQVIANFKTEVGGFYVYPGGSRNTGEEYIYYISAEIGKEPDIKVDAYGETLFEGSASELLEKINSGALEN